MISAGSRACKYWGQRKKEVRTERGGPFQGQHAVPISSCENSDGSYKPHEVILQAWMENILQICGPQAKTQSTDSDGEEVGVDEAFINVQNREINRINPPHDHVDLHGATQGGGSKWLGGNFDRGGSGRVGSGVSAVADCWKRGARPKCQQSGLMNVPT